MDLNFDVDEDLRELSAKKAWETIENFAQGQKEWDKPFKAITEQKLASLRAQVNELFGNKKVWFEMPRCIASAKVDNLSPQVLPSFEKYTPLVTYSKEVKDTLVTSIEVEPLNQTQVEGIGLNSCNDDILFSFREVPSFDELEPQPHPLPNCPSLDVSLGVERGPKPPIKPHSLDSFRMKEVDNLTFHISPSRYTVSFHIKDVYCYYHLCIDDPKKHYEFKPGLLGHSGSLGVDFSNLEVIEDDWELKSK
uniref:Ribonuclease H-like domain-containing protein n=1 Tax=Tanacetum cinerariifolium TaxID=118510 RepID=A0A699IV43_TANCI|nr:ribonuclease H-like domain-containing protein [Tanacetum cinerariifolium]